MPSSEPAYWSDRMFQNWFCDDINITAHASFVWRVVCEGTLETVLQFGLMASWPMLFNISFLEEWALARDANFCGELIVMATGFIGADYSWLLLYKFICLMDLTRFWLFFLGSLAHLAVDQFINVIEFADVAPPYFLFHHISLYLLCYKSIILLERVI
jgi:hypothetical protein